MTAKTAPLSFTSETGYYGLRVNPTFDEVLRTIRKPLGIPVPDRSAKWYANSPYRSLLLDAEELPEVQVWLRGGTFAASELRNKVRWKR